MVRMAKTLPLILPLLVVTAVAQSPKTPLAECADAMGVANVKSIQYVASGTNYALGQGVNPDERVGPKFTVKSVSVVIDYEAMTRRQDMIRTAGEKTPRGGGGVIVGEQHQAQSASGLAVWLTPHGFVKKALSSNPTVEPQTTNGRHVTFVTFTVDTNKVRGIINDQHLLEEVDSWTPHTQFGDMLVRDIYTDYKDVGGIKAPMRISREEGGYLTLDLTVSEVHPNAAVTMDADAGRGGRGGRGGGRGAGGSAATVEPEQIAEGIWRLGGINAQNSVVEFKDFVVVYEAPGDDQRTTAVIAKIKELVANKPLRYIIDSHHHVDHSGGLRGYAAAGATIVTHENYRKFYDRTFHAPRTLSPDLLAQSNKTATFVYVKGKHVITDGTRTIELYDVPNNDHANGLLIAYLPKEKLLLESDLYSPGYAAGDPDLGYPHPWNVQLYADIQRLKLDVTRIVPTHGPVSPISDLQQRVGKTASK
jgi:glyoxylase-like metal-dependent hydrolase (beta-lactamase superfamily II)